MTYSGCYPNYDKQWNKPNWRACSFFEHSTLVAPLKNNLTDYVDTCLPSCDHTNIHQSGIQVNKGAPAVNITNEIFVA